MKKIVSFVLSLAILILLISPIAIIPTYAENNAPRSAPEVQFVTDAEYSSIDTVHIYMTGTKNGKYAIMDLSGEPLFPYGYLKGNILKINNRYFGIKGDNGKYAVFSGATCLTEFKYTAFSVSGMYLKAQISENNYDFYHFDSMKAVIPPTPPAGYEILDLMADQTAYVKNTQTGRYNTIDWNGKLLDAEDHYSFRKKLDENFFKQEDYYGITYNRFGFKFLNGKIERIMYAPNKTHFLAYSTDENYNATIDSSPSVEVGIFDLNYNRLSSIAGIEAKFLDNEHILVQVGKDDYVIMHLSGEIVHRFNDSRISLAQKLEYMTIEFNVGDPGFIGYGVVSGTNGSIYNDRHELLVSTENTQFISVREDFYIVSHTDGTTEIYDSFGTQMGQWDSSRNIYYKNGVFAEEKDGKFAILSLSGERCTDYVYSFIYDTNSVGIVNAKADDGYYLFNYAGKRLNDVPLKEEVWFREDKQFTTYCTESGHGVLRYMGKNDPYFIDVPYDRWYYDAVEFSRQENLFSGYAPGVFMPEKTMTRAMLVTVLWRLEGEPEAEAPAEFTDVPDGKWYTNAVSWASENNIVKGMGAGVFAPDNEVTREQIAVFMYRYAQFKGYDTSIRGDITSFDDASSVGSYAIEAIQWASATGIINGSKEGNRVLLMPRGKASRAQVAAILMRYIQSDTKK